MKDKRCLYFTACLLFILVLPICNAAYISATDVIFPCPCELIEDGLYLGGGLGHDAYRIRQSISQILTNGFLIQASPVLYAGGLYLNVFGGYGRYFDWFYIAGEIFGGYSWADDQFRFNNYSSELSVQTSYGASILPGIMINNLSLLYLRFGYIRTYFKYHEFGSMHGNIAQSEWSNAPQFGVGIATNIYGHFDVRTKYTYTGYDSFASDLGTVFSPANGEVIVSLLYHYG